ncbi:hypothetical protein H6P81_014177 [Aristolochia fimbriata]|uniref:Uncharacterized protein n=1 Tax=Aristolochia fimbriata TaxID=158543 RepID=A0AAV7EH58_ARIFI|nr:hypothetical protein H6P81_014177 [Aristolochia fimbriata]
MLAPSSSKFPESQAPSWAQKQGVSLFLMRRHPYSNFRYGPKKGPFPSLKDRKAGTGAIATWRKRGAGSPTGAAGAKGTMIGEPTSCRVEVCCSRAAGAPPVIYVRCSRRP